MVTVKRAVVEPGELLSVMRRARLPEGVPGELVDGHLEEEEVPTTLHELVVSWLLYKLMAWLLPKGGWAFGSEHKILLSARLGRKPDVSAYFRGHKRPLASAEQESLGAVSRSSSSLAGHSAAATP